jgi:hypothetical protein
MFILVGAATYVDAVMILLLTKPNTTHFYRLSLGAHTGYDSRHSYNGIMEQMSCFVRRGYH